MENDLAHYSEYRGGVEWHVAYAHDGSSKMPVSGYVMDAKGAERLMEVGHVEGTGLMFGEFALKRHDGETRTFETFDEAMDAANRYIYRQPEEELERYPLYDLSGNEGIYHLGEAGGTLYVANAFWSEQEPGYVNHGVFAVKGDEFEMLTSGFYNGYLEIEDCVRDLARDFTPLENPDIRFVADCSREFDTAEEYREALDEGRRWRPVLVPSWNQLAEMSLAKGNALDQGDAPERTAAEPGAAGEAANPERPDGRETFRFSFGTSEHFPFHGGWVEVLAPNRMEACEMFSSHYPKRDGLINCAFVYDEREWRQAGMDGETAPGHVCHQVIDSWGPHAERSRARAELMAAGFEESFVDERSDVPRQITPEMGAKLLGLHYRMEDVKGLCPGVFWCHDEEGERYTVIDNRGDSFRIDVFPAGVDCMAYLDGLDPMSGWGERYGIEDLDEKVNRLAESTVCPVLPDPDLSEWDMNRYGYVRSGMLPVGAERAELLFEKVPLHRLYPDGLSAPLQNSWEIGEHAEGDGLFGVTVVSWMEHLADAGIARVEDIPLWRALYVAEEPSLDDLAKQARERAAERNTGRSEAPKGLRPPEIGR